MVTFESRQSLASFQKQVKVDVVLDTTQKKLSFYFDGVIDSEIDLTNSEIDLSNIGLNASPFKIGYSDLTSEKFKGTLGKISFYNKPLKADTLSSSYDNRLLLGYDFDHYKDNDQYNSFESVSDFKLDLGNPAKKLELVPSYLKWNKGLKYDDDTYVYVNLNNTNVRLPRFAYTMWMKLDSSSTVVDKCVVFKDALFKIGINSQNQLYFVNLKPGQVETIVAEESIVSTDTWMHMAVCVKGTDLRFYINGVLTGQYTLASELSYESINDGAVNIGYDGVHYLGKAIIDDIYLFEELVDNEYKNSVQQLYENLASSTNYSPFTRSYPKLEKDNWYHVAATYNSREKTMKTYHNGVLVNVYPNYTVPREFSNNLILMGKEGDDHYYQGLIDDLRVYNKALGPDEVKQVYDEFFLAGNLGSTLLNSPTLDSENFTLEITSTSLANGVFNVDFTIGTEMDSWHAIVLADHPDTISYRTVVDQFITRSRFANGIYFDTTFGEKSLAINKAIATVHSPFERREIVGMGSLNAATVFVYGKKSINGVLYEIMRAERVDAVELEPLVSFKSPSSFIRGFINFGSFFTFSSHANMETVYMFCSSTDLTNMTTLADFENIYDAHPDKVDKYVANSLKNEVFSDKTLLFTSVYDGTTFQDSFQLGGTYYLYVMVKDQAGKTTRVVNTNNISFDRYSISENINWKGMGFLPSPSNTAGTPHLSSSTQGKLRKVSTTSYGDYVLFTGQIDASSGYAKVYKLNTSTLDEYYEEFDDLSTNIYPSNVFTVPCNYGHGSSISADARYCVVSGHTSTLNSGGVYIFKKREPGDAAGEGYDYHQNLSSDQLPAGTFPESGGGYYGMWNYISPDGGFLTVNGYGANNTSGICLVFKRNSSGTFDLFQDLSSEVDGRFRTKVPMSADGKVLVMLLQDKPATNHQYAKFKYFHLNEDGSQYELKQTTLLERGGTTNSYNNLYDDLTVLNISHNGKVVLSTGHTYGNNHYGTQLLFMKDENSTDYYLHTEFKQNSGSVNSGGYYWSYWGRASALSSDGRQVTIGSYGQHNENRVHTFYLDETTNMYKLGESVSKSNYQPGDDGLAMSGTGTYVISVYNDNMYVWKGEHEIQASDVSFTSPTDEHGLIINSWFFRSHENIVRYYIFANNHATSYYNLINMKSFVETQLENAHETYVSEQVNERSEGGANFYFYNTSVINKNTTHIIESPIVFDRAFSVHNSQSHNALEKTSEPRVFIAMVDENNKVYVREGTEFSDEFNTVFTLNTPVERLKGKAVDWTWTNTNTDYLIKSSDTNGPTGIPHRSLEGSGNMYGRHLSATHHGDRVVVTSSLTQRCAQGYIIYQNDGNDNWKEYGILPGADDLFEFYGDKKAFISAAGDYIILGGYNNKTTSPKYGGAIYIWKHNDELRRYDFHQKITMADIQDNVEGFNYPFGRYIYFSKDGNYITAAYDGTTAPYPANPDAGGWNYKERTLFIFKRNQASDRFEFYQNASNYVNRGEYSGSNTYPDDGYFLKECPITSEALVICYGHQWNNPSPHTFSRFFARFRTFKHSAGLYRQLTNNETHFNANIYGLITDISLSNDALTLMATGRGFSHSYRGVGLLMKRASLNDAFGLVDTAIYQGSVSTYYDAQRNEYGDTSSMNCDGSLICIGGYGNNRDIVHIIEYSDMNSIGNTQKYLSKKVFNNIHNGITEPYCVEMSGDGQLIFTTGQNRNFYVFRAAPRAYDDLKFNYSVDENGHVLIDDLRFTTQFNAPRVVRYYVLALTEANRYQESTIRDYLIKLHIEPAVQNKTISTLTPTFGGSDQPTLIPLLDDGTSTNVEFSLGVPAGESVTLQETDGSITLNSNVNKSILELLHSVIQFKEWNGNPNDTTNNSFTITFNGYCTIFVGTFDNDTDRGNTARAILRGWFDVSDSELTHYTGYGSIAHNGNVIGQGQWYSVTVKPGTYATPSGLFGQNYNWMVFGVGREVLDAYPTGLNSPYNSPSGEFYSYSQTIPNGGVEHVMESGIVLQKTFTYFNNLSARELTKDDEPRVFVALVDESGIINVELASLSPKSNVVAPVFTTHESYDVDWSNSNYEFLIGTHYTTGAPNFNISFGLNYYYILSDYFGQTVAFVADAKIDSGVLIYKNISGYDGKYELYSGLIGGPGKGDYSFNTSKGHMSSDSKWIAFAGNGDATKKGGAIYIYKHNETEKKYLFDQALTAADVVPHVEGFEFNGSSTHFNKYLGNQLGASKDGNWYALGHHYGRHNNQLLVFKRNPETQKIEFYQDLTSHIMHELLYMNPVISNDGNYLAVMTLYNYDQRHQPTDVINQWWFFKRNPETDQLELMQEEFFRAGNYGNTGGNPKRSVSTLNMSYDGTVILLTGNAYERSSHAGYSFHLDQYSGKYVRSLEYGIHSSVPGISYGYATGHGGTNENYGTIASMSDDGKYYFICSTTNDRNTVIKSDDEYHPNIYKVVANIPRHPTHNSHQQTNQATMSGNGEYVFMMKHGTNIYVIKGKTSIKDVELFYTIDPNNGNVLIDNMSFTSAHDKSVVRYYIGCLTHDDHYHPSTIKGHLMNNHLEPAVRNGTTTYSTGIHTPYNNENGGEFYFYNGTVAAGGVQHFAESGIVLTRTFNNFNSTGGKALEKDDDPRVFVALVDEDDEIFVYNARKTPVPDFEELSTIPTTTTLLDGWTGYKQVIGDESRRTGQRTFQVNIMRSWQHFEKPTQTGVYLVVGSDESHANGVVVYKNNGHDDYYLYSVLNGGTDLHQGGSNKVYITPDAKYIIYVKSGGQTHKGGWIYTYKHDFVNKKFVIHQQYDAREFYQNIEGFTYNADNDSLNQYLGNVFAVSRDGKWVTCSYGYQQGSNRYVHMFKRNDSTELMEYYSSVDLHPVMSNKLYYANIYSHNCMAISDDGRFVFIVFTYSNHNPRRNYMYFVVMKHNDTTNQYEHFQTLDLIADGGHTTYSYALGHATNLSCSASGEWILCTGSTRWEDARAALLFKYDPEHDFFDIHTNLSHQNAGGDVYGVSYNYHNNANSAYGQYSSMSVDAKYIHIGGTHATHNYNAFFERDDETNLYSLKSSFTRPTGDVNHTSLTQYSTHLSDDGQTLAMATNQGMYILKSKPSPSNKDLTYTVDETTGHITIDNLTFRTSTDKAISRYYVTSLVHPPHYHESTLQNHLMNNHIEPAVRNGTTTYTTGINKPYNNAETGGEFYFFAGPIAAGDITHTSTDNIVLTRAFNNYNGTSGKDLLPTDEPRVYLVIVDEDDEMTTIIGRKTPPTGEFEEADVIPYVSNSKIDWKDVNFPTLIPGNQQIDGAPQLNMRSNPSLYNLKSTYTGKYLLINGNNQQSSSPVVYKDNGHDIYEEYSFLYGGKMFNLNFDSLNGTQITANAELAIVSGYGQSSSRKGGRLFIYKNNTTTKRFDIYQELGPEYFAQHVSDFTYDAETEVSNYYFGRFCYISYDGKYITSGVNQSNQIGNNRLWVLKRGVSGEFEFLADLSSDIDDHILSSVSPVSNDGTIIACITTHANYNNNNPQFKFKLHTFKKSADGTTYELTQKLELRNNVNPNYSNLQGGYHRDNVRMAADGKWLLYNAYGVWSRFGANLLFRLNETTSQYELHTDLGLSGSLYDVSYNYNGSYNSNFGYITTASSDLKYLQISGNRHDTHNRTIIYARDDETQTYSVAKSYSHLTNNNQAISWFDFSGDGSKFYTIRSGNNLYVTKGFESVLVDLEFNYTQNADTGAVSINTLQFTARTKPIVRYYVLVWTHASHHGESLVRDHLVKTYIDAGVRSGAATYTTGNHRPYNNTENGGEFYYFANTINVDTAHTGDANITLTRSFTAYNSTSGKELTNTDRPMVWVALVDEDDRIYVKRAKQAPIENFPAETIVSSTLDSSLIDWSQPKWLTGVDYNTSDGQPYMRVTPSMNAITCSSSGQYILAYEQNANPAEMAGAVVLKHNGNDCFERYTFLNGGVERASMTHYSKPSISGSGETIVISGYGRPLNSKIASRRYGMAFVYKRDDTTHTYNLQQKISSEYGTFTYRFEVNVPSSKHDAATDTSHWAYAVRSIRANGFLLGEWEHFSNIVGSPDRSGAIEDVLNDEATYAQWNWSENPVGRVLYEITTTERVAVWDVQSFQPIVTPGYKIFENDVEVFSESSNRGSSEEPRDVTYTYNMSLVTPFTEFGKKCKISPDSLTLVVGGSINNGDGTVFVYKRESVDDLFTFHQDLSPDVVVSDKVTGDYGMSLDATYLICGRYVRDTSHIGGAVVFKHNGTSYVPVSTIEQTSQAGRLGDHVTVSHNGDTVLLSGSHYQIYSSAMVFKREGSDSYTLAKNLREGVSLNNNTYFGYYSSMTSDGKYAIVISPHTDNVWFVFERDDATGDYVVKKEFRNFNSINPYAGTISDTGEYIFLLNSSDRLYILKSR